MTTPRPDPGPPPEGDDDARRMRRMTRRSFAAGGLAALGGFGTWKWLQSRPAADGLPGPFRAGHELNERVGRALFSDRHLAPEFDRSLAGDLRVNGWHGWSDDMPAAADWAIEVEAPGRPPRRVGLGELAALPRVEAVFEFKCIEGWSQVVAWGGYRFGDFLTALDLIPPDPALQYLLLSTPDGGYTVALDLPSATHPQSLLCDAMNGAPLTPGHGAPVRLVLPVKYGVKNIKWLSKIQFVAARPTDYWTARGYDWYAGL